MSERFRESGHDKIFSPKLFFFTFLSSCKLYNPPPPPISRFDIHAPILWGPAGSAPGGGRREARFAFSRAWVCPRDERRGKGVKSEFLICRARERWVEERYEKNRTGS